MKKLLAALLIVSLGLGSAVTDIAAASVSTDEIADEAVLTEEPEKTEAVEESEEIALFEAADDIEILAEEPEEEALLGDVEAETDETLEEPEVLTLEETETNEPEEDVVFARGEGSTSESNPTTIALGTKVEDVVNDSAYNRYYTFTLEEAGKINITFAHTELPSAQEAWRVELYTSGGFSSNYQILWHDSRGNVKEESLGDIGLAAGRYYLEVSRLNSTAEDVPYQFQINFEASEYWEKELDSEKNPTPIVLNHDFYGSIQEGAVDSSDYYYFTLPSAGKVDLTFQHKDSSDSNNGWRIDLYTSNGFSDSNPIFQHVSVGNVSKENLGSIGLKPGIYYIEIEKLGNLANGVTYTCRVDFTPSEYWEAEQDSKSNPKLVTLNHTYYGSIQEGAGDSNDYFWFELPKSTKITFTFGHKALSTADECWRFELYNSNGYSSNPLLQYEAKGNASKDATVSTRTLEAGKYYIEVDRLRPASESVDYHFALTTQSAKPKKVTLNQKKANLKVGEELTLQATVTPEEAADAELIWSSNKTSVATVENGVVKGIAKGTATITVKTKVGGKKATCKVTVGPVEIKMSKVTVKLNAKSFPWSGEAIEPTFTVTYAKKTVSAGEYTVSYNNNINTGTATITLTGTTIDADEDFKCFAGTKKIKFKITKHKITAEDVTVGEITEQTLVDGGAKPEPVVRYQGKELVKDVDYTVSYQNYKKVAASSAKKAPTVVIKGKGNFTGTKKVKYTIVQAASSEENASQTTE